MQVYARVTKDAQIGVPIHFLDGHRASLLGLLRSFRGTCHSPNLFQKSQRAIEYPCCGSPFQSAPDTAQSAHAL